MLKACNLPESSSHFQRSIPCLTLKSRVPPKPLITRAQSCSSPRKSDGSFEMQYEARLSTPHCLESVSNITLRSFDAVTPSVLDITSKAVIMFSTFLCGCLMLRVARFILFVVLRNCRRCERCEFSSHLLMVVSILFIVACIAFPILAVIRYLHPFRLDLGMYSESFAFSSG